MDEGLQAEFDWRNLADQVNEKVWRIPAYEGCGPVTMKLLLAEQSAVLGWRPSTTGCSTATATTSAMNDAFSAPTALNASFIALHTAQRNGPPW
jgi:hypothetical protein